MDERVEEKEGERERSDLYVYSDTYTRARLSLSLHRLSRARV